MIAIAEDDKAIGKPGASVPDALLPALDLPPRRGDELSSTWLGNLMSWGSSRQHRYRLIDRFNIVNCPSIEQEVLMLDRNGTRVSNALLQVASLEYKSPSKSLAILLIPDAKPPPGVYGIATQVVVTQPIRIQTAGSDGTAACLQPGVRPLNLPPPQKKIFKVSSGCPLCPFAGPPSTLR